MAFLHFELKVERYTLFRVVYRVFTEKLCPLPFFIPFRQKRKYLFHIPLIEKKVPLSHSCTHENFTGKHQTLPATQCAPLRYILIKAS